MAHNVQAPRRPAQALANDSIEKAMIDEYYLPCPGAGWSEHTVDNFSSISGLLRPVCERRVAVC